MVCLSESTSWPATPDRSETTRWAEASETIQLLPVVTCGLVHSEYIETTTKGSIPGYPTFAAASVPQRLTPSSLEAASSIDLVSIHSTSTRFDSFATAVRHGRSPSAPGVLQGPGLTLIRLATSGGGALASCRRATSAPIPVRTRQGSIDRAIFQEMIFTSTYKIPISGLLQLIPAHGSGIPTTFPEGVCHATLWWNKPPRRGDGVG